MESKIVYIVIAIIIAIVSTISKANKKKAASKLGKPVPPQRPSTTRTSSPNLPGNQPRQTPPPIPSNMNQDIDALFASLQKPKVEKEEPKVVAEPKVVSEPKIAYETMKTEKHKKKFREETSINFKETELEIEEVEDSYLDDFDPQKAIIYSEIINRKYT